ncbi:MAG: hypothetical protein OES46_09370 [Gammaproteobacteria bacterium]|nr:hypothetical protein [Gammaproteobacteria bacterium]
MTDVLQEFTAQVSQVLGGYVPQTLGPLAILTFGWITAGIIAGSRGWAPKGGDVDVGKSKKG